MTIEQLKALRESEDKIEFNEAKHNFSFIGSDFAQGKIGDLEDEVYNRLRIRVRIEELQENGLRVLVVNIPSRPVGKTLKFEAVPLNFLHISNKTTE